MQASVAVKGGAVVTQDRRMPRARALALVAQCVFATSLSDDGLDDLIGPDPFASATRELGQTRVALTLVGGHTTFEGENQ